MGTYSAIYSERGSLIFYYPNSKQVWVFRKRYVWNKIFEINVGMKLVNYQMRNGKTVFGMDINNSIKQLIRLITNTHSLYLQEYNRDFWDVEKRKELYAMAEIMLQFLYPVVIYFSQTNYASTLTNIYNDIYGRKVTLGMMLGLKKVAKQQKRQETI